MADDLAPPSRSLKTQQSERNLNEWRHNVNRNFHRTRSRRVVLTEMSEAQRLEVEEAWGIMLGDSKPASAYIDAFGLYPLRCCHRSPSPSHADSLPGLR